MTEFWKSNPNYWCDICKVWMNDTKASRLNHERGAGHQANLKNKLKQMARQQKEQQQQEESSQRLMASLEERAKAQYDADQAAMQSALEAMSGRWVYSEDTKLYYNALHRWYYDTTSSFYYGGDPVDWTHTPKGLPDVAKFERAPRDGGPAAGPGRSQSEAAAAKPAAPKQAIRQPQPDIPKHPLADVGGYQMPTMGRIGGAKGLASSSGSGGSGSGSAPAASAATDNKRKRDASDNPKAASKKPMSKEEEEALAKREAARQRVQQRTMAAFGLG